MTIDVDTVGRAIAERSWRLAFPAELEAHFEADTSDERCRRVIRHNYVGIAIYNAFVIGDRFLIPDIFVASLYLHLLVMTPIMVLVIAVLRRRPPAWLRESILAGGIVLGTSAILGLMLMSHVPTRTTEHISVVLVILFATIVQRIRFPYVLAAGIVSLCLYVAALMIFIHHDPARMAVADAVFAGVVLFSLIGCYNLEYEQRLGYLLALRDGLRNAELETISRRDALTGVGNRRALDHALADRQPVVGAARATPTAVLLIDIDFFKAYNDANGHLAGDISLQRVARLIGGDARLDRDSVFRFGGEEFLVLLDDCALVEAHAVAERIRRSIEEAEIGLDAVAGSLTVSIGVASSVVGESAGLADLIADADRALYAAKYGGRNQVRHFDQAAERCELAATMAAA